MTLTRQHRLLRLRWARQFQHWQHRNWQRVLFSDESTFQLFRADDRTQIYRRAGERTALWCVQETVPFGGGSVMVWSSSICGQQRTDLIVKSYCTPLLAHGGHTRYWNMFYVVKFIHLHEVHHGSITKNRFDDPSHHERTLFSRSSILNWKGFNVYIPSELL